MPPERSFEYDIALSFASEQRPYVEETVEQLRKHNLKVFYDADQQVDLWGADLYQKLTWVYSEQAHFCVVFISAAYRDKLWTRHELKAIQARAFQESREYLLPVKFDEVDIPGLLPTIGYIDGNQTTEAQLATLIAAKVGKEAPEPDKVQASFNSPIGNETELKLANAVFDAEEYLKPVPLHQADPVAQRIRDIFKVLNIEPNRGHLAPYLVDRRAAFRVVGYIAWQIFKPEDTVLDLIACVNAEQVEALHSKETRPLWQLLVCFTYFLSSHPESELSEMIRHRLRQLAIFLNSDGSIDSGGHCRHRVEKLVL